MSKSTESPRPSGRRSTGRVKLEDIARYCGVSVSTVSRVINDRTDRFPLAQPTIDKVHAAAHELGYRPNRLARAIAYGKTNLIGLSIPHHRPELAREAMSDDAYFTAQIFGLLAGGILDNPKILNYDLVIHDRRKFNHSEHRYDAFQTDLLDGIIYCNPTTGSIPFIQSLRADFPIVLLGHSLDLADRVISVDVDNVTAARQCIDHLITIGRKRILILIPENLKQYLCIRDRLKGYQTGIREGGLAHSPEDIVSLPQSDPAIAQWIDACPSLQNYDAIVAPTDEMAVFCLKNLGSKGVRVPEEIAVIGFSDSSECLQCEPPLTSVRMPFHEMGFRAADLLIDVLNGNRPLSPEHHAVSAEIKIRRSSVA